MSKIRVEKGRHYIRYILPIIAAFSFVVCVLEGYVYYYSSEKSLYVQILMNINNAFKAFLFSPTISIGDARKAIEQQDVSMANTILCYLYMTIVILAPICTATAVLKAIEKSLRNWMNRFKHTFQKKVFVFGYNKSSKEFIMNLADCKKKIIVVTQQELEDRAKLDLLKKGIVIVYGDFSNEKEFEVKYDLRKMRINRADAIVLFEESTTTNFSIFLTIVEHYKSQNTDGGFLKQLGYKKESNCVKCSISCDDYGMQEIITDYYDKYMIEVLKVKGNKTYIDLKLFSVPEIMTRELFRYKPLYSYNLKNKEAYSKEHYKWEESTAECINPWDTHLVIVGFGELGQNVLQQALNLGNLQSKSTITIDVFDKTMNEKKGIFAKRFSRNNVIIDKESIRLPEKSEYVDGKVIINFHQIDIRTIDFKDTLKKLQQVTFVAICFENSSLSTLSMVTIARYFLNVPIAVRMDVDKKVIEYIKRNQESYKEVFPFGTGKEILNETSIIENDNDKQSILYNSKYNEYVEHQKKPKSNEEKQITRSKLDDWNKMSYLKRSSSRKAVEHQTTKIVLLLVGAWIKQRIPYDIILHKVDLLMECIEKQENYEDLNIEKIYSHLDDTYHLLSAKKLEEIFSVDKALEELAALEHRRYCNYMYSNGYRYEEREKDDFAKTNPCLLSWEQLRRKKPEMLIYDLLSIIVCAEKMDDNIIEGL